MGLWLRWLERTPDKGEVTGSSPVRPTIFVHIAKRANQTKSDLSFTCKIQIRLFKSITLIHPKG